MTISPPTNRPLHIGSDQSVFHQDITRLNIITMQCYSLFNSENLLPFLRKFFLWWLGVALLLTEQDSASNEGHYNHHSDCWKRHNSCPTGVVAITFTVTSTEAASEYSSSWTLNIQQNALNNARKPGSLSSLVCRFRSLLWMSGVKVGLK